MTKDESIIQALAVAKALIGEKAFSEAWTSFIEDLIEDEAKPIPFIDYTNYREDDEEE